MRAGDGRGAAIAAAVVGSALEWFNFALFGVLAVTVAPLFFAGDDMSALLRGFATVGAALLFRPVGGFVLGAYADRAGRRNALALVFALMAASTLAIALLPTRETVGALAPVLLAVCLSLQAFSAGGEFANASVSLVEFAPPGRRGLYGSLQLCSQAGAILAGSVLALTLEASLDRAQMDSFGWRLPFLAGALLGPVGLWMRLRVSETPAFAAAMAARPAAAPAAPLGPRGWGTVAAGLLLFAAVLGPSYTNSKFLPQLAQVAYGVSREHALLTVICSAVLMVFLVPLMGFLSDVAGRTRVAVAGALGMAAAYPFLFARFHADPGLGTLMALQVAYSVPFAAVVGAAATLVAEAFPIGRRATGTAIAYNVAAVAFGGGAPLAVDALSRAFGQGAGPSAFMAAVSLAAAGGAAVLGRRRAEGIGSDPVPAARPGPA